MKEHPMIFNAEMVRAILDGRKTQTRRIMKPQPANDIQRGAFPNSDTIGWISSLKHKHGSTTAHFCHFGSVGDRIWVRETWGVVSNDFDEDGRITDWIPDRSATAIHEMPFGNGYYTGHAIYAADGAFTWGDDDGCVDGRSCWKPSIHMPRWASRITLEITGVRVERLNDINDADALAEGCSTDELRNGECLGDVYHRLWASIYGEESWQANQWVWVIEFKRVEGGAA